MIPEHYSRDIAARCQHLIRHLKPKVEAGLPADAQFGGPLRMTFLLAMATPMVVLPIERIFKPSAGATTIGDDTKLDPKLARQIAHILGPRKTFGAAPFATTSRWSYVNGHPLFNIAEEWPPDLLKALADPRAIEASRIAPASRILCDLRNALAHGGIAYLDQNGQNTERLAAMFAFASTKMVDQKVVGLNILRVSEGDFCAFLEAWSSWLGKSSVADALNNRSRLAA
jgi:hypothetical protein